MSKTDSRVGVIMGSQSDWPTMREACVILDEFGIEHEQLVVSAHRTPEWMFQYAEAAAGRGLKIIIAGAGGAAHLPGMVAASTTLPVLGVPIQSKALSGLDSLLSIIQMPGGVPVGTLAIGTSGAKNAGLLAVRILALHDEILKSKLRDYQRLQTQRVLDDVVPRDR
ncbi:MAG: 5-(carboxyamino)imidazole ribonucleotide mutase [Planctomycetota bacterium]